jgi:adenylosuccinate synthase
MGCTIIAGGQRGDEAKSKIASYLAIHDDVRLAVRAGLGPGAGHTVCLSDKEWRFRQVPSAGVHRSARLLLSAGVLIDPNVVLGEVEAYDLACRIGIDYRATVIDDCHRNADKASEHLSKVVGSTGSGHGPARADRAIRTARRAESVPELKPYLVDASDEINAACDRGEKVQIEGTNGFLLSVLFGTYPHTVGKDSTASAIAADAGIGPLRVSEVVLTFKTFPTRVGGGIFPTEMEEAEADRRGFTEYGTVTRRRRRVGEFDFELAKQAVRVNHPSYLALTFLDRLDPDAKGPGLTRPMREFVDKVENLVSPRFCWGREPIRSTLSIFARVKFGRVA